MWHDQHVNKCYNHKDRQARFYEDQSGLYFCTDCHHGLRNASERDLYLMTHKEVLKVNPDPVVLPESVKNQVNDWTSKKKH